MNKAVAALDNYRCRTLLASPTRSTRTDIDDIADILAEEVERLERELAQALDRKEAADHHRLEVIRDLTAHPRFAIEADDLKLAYWFLRSFAPHCRTGSRSDVNDLAARLAQHALDIDKAEKRPDLSW